MNKLEQFNKKVLKCFDIACNITNMCMSRSSVQAYDMYIIIYINSSVEHFIESNLNHMLCKYTRTQCKPNTMTQCKPH